MRSGCAWLPLVSLLAAPTLTAQQPSGNRPAGPVCYRARPAPACPRFLFTNAGGYAELVGPDASERLRAIVQWGLMVNRNARDAVGASWFVSLDAEEFSTGPAVHYRRWLDPTRSLDLAVGTPLLSGGGLRTGSLLGLVRYSPVHWFGLAMRPEYARRTDYRCDATGCTEFTANSGRVYVGVEVGWFPGLTLSLAGGATVALALATVVN